jgi:hypothetical protein
MNYDSLPGKPITPTVQEQANALASVSLPAAWIPTVR